MAKLCFVDQNNMTSESGTSIRMYIEQALLDALQRSESKRLTQSRSDNSAVLSTI